MQARSHKAFATTSPEGAAPPNAGVLAGFARAPAPKPNAEDGVVPAAPKPTAGADDGVVPAAGVLNEKLEVGAGVVLAPKRDAPPARKVKRECTRSANILTETLRKPTAELEEWRQSPAAGEVPAPNSKACATCKYCEELRDNVLAKGPS